MLTVTLANATLCAFDFVRPSYAVSLVKKIVGTPRDRPILLLIGSSLTQYGVDRSLLEAELAARGLPYRVVKYAIGGFSGLERLHYLREIQQRSAGLRPSMVLMEVSAYYDKQPLLQFKHNLFSDRMVDMLTAETARRALRWTWEAPSLGFHARLGTVFEILQHAAAHYLSIGTKFRFSLYSTLPLPGESTDMEALRDRKLSNEVLDPLLDSAINVLQGDAHEPVEAWADDFYDAMISVLKSGAAPEFGFYMLPTTSTGELIYARSFCEHRPGSYCVTPNSAIMNSLRDRSKWFDVTHLIGEGTKLTTAWFAGELASRVPRPVIDVPESLP